MTHPSSETAPDAPRRSSRRRIAWLAACALILVAAGVFRLRVVDSWHVPGGDGLNYHRLSQELVASGRFSFGPPPTAPSYSRLPGYPLFLAYLAVRSSASMELHLVRATRANVLLDFGTALLVLLIIRERWLGGRAASLIALAATLTCPLILLLSCYGLTETLATFLATLEVYLALRAMRTRLILHAALVGAVAGLAQLTRADAITVAPAVALAIFWAAAPLRRRAVAAAVGLGVFLAIFSPWPIRNLATFGHPHFAATYWRDAEGNPLPDEPIAWERTWGSGAPGEDHLDLFFYFNHRLAPDGSNVLQAAMFDDAAERQRVFELFQRYSKERWSPSVISGFAELARDRTRRRPLRTWVTLPLRRMVKLWSPVPEWELPMRTPLLGLPAHRPFFGTWDLVAYALALVGAVALGWKGRGAPERRTLVLIASCIVARTLLYGFASPVGVTERYLIEAYPLLIVLAVFGVATVLPSLALRAWRRVASRAGRAV